MWSNSQPWPCTHKSLDLGSASEQSVARVVARRPASRAASRMGCVVDSTTRPARDGSDGCCYLTPPLLLWLPQPAREAGAKVSPWTTATSQVYALPAQKTCMWCNPSLKIPNILNLV